MTKAREITEEVQERVLESVQVGQQAVVDCVRSWSTTVETLFRRLPELSFTDNAKPNEQGNYTFESGYEFTERLMKSQRDFASQVLEALVPATRSATEATKQAAGETRQAPTPPRATAGK